LLEGWLLDRALYDSDNDAVAVHCNGAISLTGGTITNPTIDLFYGGAWHPASDATMYGGRNDWIALTVYGGPVSDMRITGPCPWITALDGKPVSWLSQVYQLLPGSI
jgi:hypothetical protein